ncbi:MAG TPA: hypothetical protein DEA22_05530 [Blastocatellia bacterium]|nr:hypothetical protein [Blastocatellia bacterium]
MALETKFVFIDTESYMKAGLNFNHSAMQSFASLCGSGKLSHLITSVVKREVKSKITAEINEALSSLRSFRRKARLLEKINDKEINGLFTEVDETKVHAKAQAVFDEFLVACGSKTLDAASLDPEVILDLYFEKKPPFGSGKKKSEFPDAFSLHALLKAIGKNKCYVVSDDPDIKSACEATDSLISVESLDKFLDVYNEHENAITELFKAYLEKQEESIRKIIKDKLNEVWAYNEADWEDSEVDEFHVVDVDAFEPAVVSISETNALVTFDAYVYMEYTVTGPNFTDGIYDKEAGKVITFDMTSRSGYDTKTFSGELEYTFEFVDGKLNVVGEPTVSIAGLTDGIGIYMEENPYEWQI